MASSRRPAVLALVLMVVLCGCTGVPTSSAPQIVKSLAVGDGDTPNQPIVPDPGVKPRSLVESFLDANALDASEHASAREFLSPEARTRWSDLTVTVVDATNTGFPAHHQVIVTGRVLGALNSSGVYTPTSTTPLRRFVYGISRVGGQYRIGNLATGLLLTEDQFLNAFKQRNLYFFDLAGRYLVPDPRWTSLTDPTQLSVWLLTALAAGPSPLLANAVSNTLPAQATARRLTVSTGTPAKVEITGAGQLDRRARNRLAAQVGSTLDDAQGGRTLEITDGGRPVVIPTAGRAEFTASGFGDAIGPQLPSADVYFLRGGRIFAADDKPLAGAVNNGRYFPTSIAVSRSGSDSTLAVAAVASIGGTERLLLGTQSAGLRPTSVRGVLTRPAFAPGRVEAWVGDGARVYVATPGVNGRSARVARVALPSQPDAGQIIALRLSPEGSRIAVVIRTAGGAQQLFVGAVVRVAGQVRIDTLQLISPVGVVITDVAWVESLKLYTTGYDASSQDAHFYQMGVDGSVFETRGIGELTGPPGSLTIEPGQPAWVSAGGAVWVQRGGTDWHNPGPSGPSGQTNGSDPVYLE